MTPEPSPDDTASLRARIRDLENQVKEREETLEAIRHGDIDAIVVHDRFGEPRVYTLETADRPYQMLIEQMQEGAVTLAADGTIIYSNRRLPAMLNVPEQRIIGQTLQRFLSPDDVAGFTRLLREAPQVGVRHELALRTADGKDVPVHVSLSRLPGHDPTLLCGVLTDLTTQKLHLQELAKANAQLVSEIAERERAQDALRHAQKMEAIGRLTGGIAHDFNNMLQAVTGGIALARTRLASGRVEDTEKLLGAALMAADRAATLTRRLLAFGRRQTLDPKLVALDALIGGMKGLIEQTVGPGITVEFRLENDSWPVMCDPNQLENALLNLVINARDALPAGGRVSIETTHVTLDDADTRHRDGVEPGDYVRITVADTGIGMPADVLAHAFEPFFTTKPDGQGTGLGLSQLEGFVRQSLGTVRLESRLGTGTSVHVYLPRCRAELSGATETVASRHKHRPAEAAVPATVLLVEDEEMIREFVTEALLESGYRVIEAADGPSGLTALQAALRAPRENEVRILVTDIGLPGGLNGRQLADAARELMPDLPVLLITGYGADAYSGKQQLGSRVSLLSKPFALEALTGRVQAMIEQTESA
jgi:PAS domain S-box-containing protein